LLRQEGEPHAALAPAPGLADPPFLLDQVREAGLDITLTMLGDVREVSAPLDLTTYRIVQEALTNILKHGGLTARVRINHSVAEVFVEVLDEGRPRGPHPAMSMVDVGHGRH
jgi:signal transduction histidine kinase